MAEKYPQRPQYWAHRLIRLLAKSCAANEIGIEGCWLVTTIALIEDSKRYSGPVSFWNGQLQPVCGFASWDRLDRARKRAVNAGWLHYIPGRKSVCPLYWSLIPEHVCSAHDDTPLDAFVPGNSEQNAEQTTTTAAFDPQNADQNADNARNKTRTMRGTKRGTSVPVPKPNPKTVVLPAQLRSSEFAAIWEEWQAHRREIKKPLTPTSTKQQLNKLAEMGETRAIAALRHTIANGWQGLREPETNGHARPQNVTDAWQMARAIVCRVYSPDLRNVDDVRAAMSPRAFSAVSRIGLATVANSHPADRDLRDTFLEYVNHDHK